MTRRFSASSAAQFMACPGSANLELSIPGWQEPEHDDSKGARAKGTMLHEYFALVGKLSAKDLARVAEAMDYVAKLRALRRFKVLIEEEVVAEWLPSKPTTTVDLCLYVKDEIHIIDWKSGTIPVMPENNEQLMFYAASLAHLAPQAEWVHLHIVQPWAENGINSWCCPTETLRDFMKRAIRTDRLITTGDTTLSPSDHCTFCPANPHSRGGEKGRPLCPKMLQLLYPSSYDEAAILDL